MSNLEPKIYVACLASYNAGILHGAWIDMSQDADTVWDKINAMLASSSIPNAEAWEIHDYEDFGDITINQIENINSIIAIAQFINEHGQLGAKLIAYAGDLYSANEFMDDKYQGEYASEEDFARYIFGETMEIPNGIDCYIDYEMVARDLFMSDYLCINIDAMIHVFSCC